MATKKKNVKIDESAEARINAAIARDAEKANPGLKASKGSAKKTTKTAKK